MDRLPGRTPAVQVPSRQGLRMALLVSRDEQQLPVGNVSSSRFPVNGCGASSACWLSQVGEEATHHQYNLFLPCAANIFLFPTLVLGFLIYCALGCANIFS